MTGFSGSTKVLIGLVLILQPMAGLPAAQAARITQDTVLPSPPVPHELDQWPEGRRYDVRNRSRERCHTRRCPDTEVEAVLASAVQVAGGRLIPVR